MFKFPVCINIKSHRSQYLTRTFRQLSRTPMCVYGVDQSCRAGTSRLRSLRLCKDLFLPLRGKRPPVCAMTLKCNVYLAFGHLLISQTVASHCGRQPDRLLFDVEIKSASYLCNSIDDTVVAAWTRGHGRDSSHPGRSRSSTPTPSCDSCVFANDPFRWSFREFSGLARADVTQL